MSAKRVACALGAAWFLAVSGCGSRREKISTAPVGPIAPGNDDVVAVPLPSPTVIGTPSPSLTYDSFLVAYDNRFVVERYSADGKIQKSWDLSSSEALAGVTTGGITAITPFDGRMLVFVDPGEGGERIVSLGTDGSVQSWYSFPADREKLKCRSLVVVQDKDVVPRIYAVRETGVELFLVDGVGGRLVPSPEGGPYIPSKPAGSADCSESRLVGMSLISSMKTQGLLTLGIAGDGQGGVLNSLDSLLGGSQKPHCVSSFRTGSGARFTESIHSPVQAVQGTADDLYVLFGAGQGAHLVRYVIGNEVLELAEDIAVSTDSATLETRPVALAWESTAGLLVANGLRVVRIDLPSGQPKGFWNIDASHISVLTPAVAERSSATVLSR